MALLKGERRETWRAPYCFVHEAANMMLRQERRGSVRAGAVEAMLLDLVELNVRVEPPPNGHQLQTAIGFGRKHGVSVFDGFYLALAQDLDATLATRDARLVVAAQRERCVVLDLRTPS